MKQNIFPTQMTRVIDHAAEISARLQISARTMAVSEKIIKVLGCSKWMVGKDPTGIACATIYISSLLTGERRTQRQIAAAATTTEATIRARCRELEKNLLFIIRL
jgi:transcription initiation factor TFIIB